ncbi:glycosyltransferase family 2 protein [Chitinophaga sancti]|uniref:glycosyltransferase family 2 protein n=1 Tax=Chitinophaga sancti TaxID=1004 RepID=UPI002A7498F5|nr:glycosyltransferase family 2 protein [Chitinophaga sancti]WPQ64528.1 glycosyltransferase family 2 protein [Chitinophaga sancti]
MKEYQPLVSIITVVYNGIISLEKTILSVLGQSFQNIEYIIIDGGSTDGSVDIIKKYADRLAYWVSEPDKGIYYAMNKGIDQASGEWINFMNVGDWFYSADSVNDIFGGENLNGYDLVYGNTEKRRGDKSEIYIPGDASNFYKRLMIHQSTFSRTSLNRKYKFDTTFKVSADFDFMFKVFLYKHKTLHVDVVVSSFDLVGFSHDNRYRGFSEDRVIAFKYKGNLLLSCKVYLFYVYITGIGKAIDLMKTYLPGVYKQLKKMKG